MHFEERFFRFHEQKDQKRLIESTQRPIIEVLPKVVFLLLILFLFRDFLFGQFELLGSSMPTYSFAFLLAELCWCSLSYDSFVLLACIQLLISVAHWSKFQLLIELLRQDTELLIELECNDWCPTRYNPFFHYLIL